LRALGSLARELRNDGEHRRVQAGLGLVDGDERVRLRIREHREQQQKPQRAVGQVRPGLGTAQRAPPQAELDALVGRRRERQLLEVVAEGGTHGGVNSLPELPLREYSVCRTGTRSWPSGETRVSRRATAACLTGASSCTWTSW
jgi:hypothetical protein